MLEETLFRKIGGLSDYWHIIAYSKELPKKTSIKKTIYGVPILLWRDNENKVHSLVDSCAHKRSPLAVSCFSQNEITCPYHGWKYDKTGQLIEIPSSPHIDCAKLNGSLQTFSLIENQGLIWIAFDKIPFNKATQESDLPFSLQHEKEEVWAYTSSKHLFETTEELLIENFMDATHTPFTHEGLIRGSGDKVAHQVTLSTHEKGLLVAYAETKEKIGVGLRFILGKDIRVKHTDEFLLPNIVKVDYLMNDVHRFTAIIACNPIGNEKTEAIIRLSFNFGKLNSIIKLILPRLAKKVIAQDFEITKQQFDNQKIFNWQKDKPIDCDNVFHKMKKIRRVAIDRSESVRPSETSFKLYL